MSRFVTFAAGDLSLSLAPDVGGAVARFAQRGLSLFRDTSPDALAPGLAHLAASYPMVPYCNRIGAGRFSFAGEDLRLRLNFGDAPNAIHGLGWQRRWRVERIDATAALLTLDHEPGRDGADDWPYGFRAFQNVALSPEGLTISIGIENRHSGPMPAGIGLHPYFSRHPETRLRFSAREVWRNGPTMLPEGRMPVPPEWDCSRDLPIAEMAPVDHCFDGWDGRAEITFQHLAVRLRIVADPVFGKLVVYRGAGKDFFAVEPVSHMVDAVNRMHEPGHGLVVLRPGEQLSGQVRFLVDRL